MRHLSRLFREEAGVTVLAYLQHIRIAIARERLETTALNIEQVAEAAGFSSAHQLRRVWRRRASTPPSRERAANRRG